MCLNQYKPISTLAKKALIKLKRKQEPRDPTESPIQPH